MVIHSKCPRWRRRLTLLDEDALPGALLGRFGDSIVEVLGHKRHARGTARFASNLVALLHVGETVVEQRKDGRRDLLAQAVTGARSWSIHTFMDSPLRAPFG